MVPLGLDVGAAAPAGLDVGAAAPPGLDVGAAAPPGLDVGAAAPPGWNCTRMLRPIAVEYTSRYSTGKPSRENAFAFGALPTMTANAGTVNTAAAIASRRRSRYCTALTTDVRGICCAYRPFACPRRINGGLEIAIAPTWLRRYQNFQKTRPANKQMTVTAPLPACQCKGSPSARAPPNHSGPARRAAPDRFGSW